MTKSAADIRKEQEEAEAERAQKALKEHHEHMDAIKKKRTEEENFVKHTVQVAINDCDKFIELAQDASQKRDDTIPNKIQAVIVAKFKETPNTELLKPLMEMLKSSGYDALSIRQKKVGDGHGKKGWVGNVIPFKSKSIELSRSGIAPHTPPDGRILVISGLTEGIDLCCYIPSDFEYREQDLLIAARW